MAESGLASRRLVEHRDNRAIGDRTGNAATVVALHSISMTTDSPMLCSVHRAQAPQCEPARLS